MAASRINFKTISAAVTGVATLLEAVKILMDYKNEAIDEYKNSAKSVTEANKASTIESRVYLDSLIVNEPVVHPLLMSLQNLYAAYILNTIQLNEFVTDSRKVSDTLSVIATEDVQGDPELYNSISDDFMAFAGLEAQDNNRTSAKQSTEALDDDREKQSVTFNDPPAPKNPLPEGRQLAVKLTSPNKEKEISVNVFIILKPYYVKQKLVKEIIKLDSRIDILKRYFQWRAGEIAFWKDFVFQIDQIQQRMKTARSDESGTVYDYIATQTKKKGKRIGDLISRFGRSSDKEMSSNVANTILVFSEDAVKRAKADASIDLHKSLDRIQYFENTFAMFIAIIDPMYNKVTLYINGHKDGATYSYNDFTSRSKDTADIKSILDTISQNRMPSGGRF